MVLLFLILSIFLVCCHYFCIVHPKTRHSNNDDNEGKELLKRIQEKKEEKERMRNALTRIVYDEMTTWNEESLQELG